MHRVWALIAVVAVLLITGGVAQADPDRFAPVDRPGPPLSVPDDVLDASLRCTEDLDDADVDPVLLLSGTTVDPDENFGWNYQPALTGAGIPWCASFAPDANMADIAERGEYVVHAIRTMHERSGRDVAIVGFSQGGMVGRWALRFWPDTRRKVSDVIGLAPSNNGTLDADGICTPDCAPSIWQQRTRAAFIEALNSRQATFDGIDYTVIYTQTDQVVTPQPAGSALPHGPGQVRNVAVQEVCPGRPVDHLGLGSFDAVGAALAFDALTHHGPADPERVGRTVCLQAFMPGVDPASFPADNARYHAAVVTTLVTYPHVPAEPPLACYTRAEGCAAEDESPQIYSVN